jgi:bacillithiol biosynthesis deacetylase BshB1
MPVDLLAFAAHRDDIEITCGGLLARMVSQGAKVGACDLTQGEMGTLGSAAEREAEAAEAARILGLSVRVNCRIPDAAIFNTREYQERVVEVLREQRPKVVVLPSHRQRHPDHRITPQLVFDACFFAGLAKFGKGEKHRPTKVIYCHHHGYDEGRPDFVVDISAHLERKISAVLAYKTQFPDREKVSESLRARGRVYGLLAGVMHAEGYLQREPVLVDDVLSLPVASL